MNRILIRLFISVFAVLLLSSCVESLNLDSDGKMPIVVDCVLTRDTVQTLRLYHMMLLSESVKAPVDNAEVLLQEKDKDGKLKRVAVFRQADGIYWKTEFQPEYDTEYSLLITIPGEEDITAATRFPADLRLIKCRRTAYYVADTVVDDGGVGNSPAAVMYTAEVRKGAYYTEWKWYKNDDGSPFKAYLQVSEAPCKMWIFPHEDTTGVTAAGQKLNILKEESYIYRGSDQPLAKYVATNHNGADRFNITLKSISSLSFWNRSKTTKTDYSGWCLYLCPDVPVFDGFVRIDHSADYRNGLSEKDLAIDYNYSDRSFYIEGNYADSYDPSKCHSFLNEVHFLSEEYDKYLRDLYVKSLEKDDFVLSSYNYTNVYSNIKGGVGIFGADNITWDVTETLARIDYLKKGWLLWEQLCPASSF